MHFLKIAASCCTRILFIFFLCKFWGSWSPAKDKNACLPSTWAGRASEGLHGLMEKSSFSHWWELLEVQSAALFWECLFHLQTWPISWECAGIVE